MKPTPKEKAEELFNKFLPDSRGWESKKLRIFHAKVNALICVDEILAIDNYRPYQIAGIELTYWKEVKQEIEKL